MNRGEPVNEKLQRQLGKRDYQQVAETLFAMGGDDSAKSDNDADSDYVPSDNEDKKPKAKPNPKKAKHINLYYKKYGLLELKGFMDTNVRDCPIIWVLKLDNCVMMETRVRDEAEEFMEELKEELKMKAK
jgi:hypothetical protein